jgi:hypothetical protein
MDVTFGQGLNLPEKYKPGMIYFIGGEGAIYFATSETEIVKYSSYEDLKKLNESKQDTIEDLDTIRNEAAIGATMAQNFSIISNEDIDILFDTNN